MGNQFSKYFLIYQSNLRKYPELKESTEGIRRALEKMRVGEEKTGPCVHQIGVKFYAWSGCGPEDKREERPREGRALSILVGLTGF